MVEAINENPTVVPNRSEITLGDAVEVKWPSRLGYFYQVQSSEDLETWTNLGTPVLGDGKELSQFFRRQSGKNTYYRAEIANFQR